MARCSFKMPDDFLMRISKLAEHTDDIVPRVLEAGGEVVLRKVRSNLNSVIGSNTKYPSRSTGTLQSSLGMSPVKMDNAGNFNIKIGFVENRRDRIANAMLANLIEYGKSGQPPKPFLKPAQRQSQSECIETMKSKLEEEIGKL